LNADHEILALFRDDPWVPDLAPTTRYSYSSYGYNTLAMAVQNASDLSFQEYLAQTILRPLELKSVRFDQPGLGVLNDHRGTRGTTWSIFASSRMLRSAFRTGTTATTLLAAD
jgi:CubicO group peptidase (beta-lactamase class C family)